MVRAIRPFLVLITATVTFLIVAPQAVYGDAEQDGITVELPSGATLPPGRYSVEIRTDDGAVSAYVVVAGAPSATASSPSSQTSETEQATPTSAPNSSASTVPDRSSVPADEQSDSFVWVLLVVVLAGFSLVGGFFGCRRLFASRRRVRQYRTALEMIQHGRYKEALPVLSRCQHRLPDRLSAQARFFVAFALFRSGSLNESEHQLAALHRENPQDMDVAYLLAYLRVTRHDHDGAEPVLEAIEAAGGMDRRPARLLYGVVEFHRALEALRVGQVEAAAMLFQKVERLGDFADRIPADLRNRHVVLGAQALFDKDLVAARGQFEDLVRAAEEVDGDQRESILASAEIGLALAAWLDDTPNSLALVDPLLVRAAKRLDPVADTEMPWTYVPDDGEIASRLAALTERQSGTTQLDDTDLALRSLHLLRAAAMLRGWAAERTPDTDRERMTEVLDRLACAHERDPEFGDPYLIAGLLKCYLATEERDRAAGVALLRRAQQVGVREPELVRILNQEARRGRARRDAAERYLQTLDRYIADPSVRHDVRVSLLERLSRYGKVRPLDRRPELARARVVSPTVDQMNGRSELLRERLNQLMTARSGNENLTAARQLAQNLATDSRLLTEQARSVEMREADLLVLVGDWLLGDDER